VRFYVNAAPQNLSGQQIEELHDDIERYLSLEHVDVNIDFWTVRRLICCRGQGCTDPCVFDRT
jgi:hypothetical protein